MKKVLSIVLALAMVLGCSAMAFAAPSVTGPLTGTPTEITSAGAISTDIKYYAEGAQFKVAMPTAVTVYQDNQGNITTPDEGTGPSIAVGIANRGAAPISITNIAITPATGWQEVPFGSDNDATNTAAGNLIKENIGTKKFAITCFGHRLDTVFTYSASSFSGTSPAAAAGVMNPGSACTMGLDLLMAPQATLAEGSAATFCTVVVTTAWAA
jgi:hypothetical protein